MERERRRMSYSTVEAAALAGITVRQANHWAARGYVRPERVGGTGSGYRLRWMREDVEKCAMLGALSRVLGLGPNGSGEPLGAFAMKLAVQRETGACGLLVTDERSGEVYEVLIEVRQLGHDGPRGAVGARPAGPRRLR
jgi:hypothetical protein